jgi:hypothetical protein
MNVSTEIHCHGTYEWLAGLGVRTIQQPRPCGYNWYCYGLKNNDVISLLFDPTLQKRSTNLVVPASASHVSSCVFILFLYAGACSRAQLGILNSNLQYSPCRPGTDY